MTQLHKCVENYFRIKVSNLAHKIWRMSINVSKVFTIKVLKKDASIRSCPKESSETSLPRRSNCCYQTTMACRSLWTRLVYINKYSNVKQSQATEISRTKPQYDKRHSFPMKEQGRGPCQEISWKDCVLSVREGNQRARRCVGLKGDKGKREQL